MARPRRWRRRLAGLALLGIAALALRIWTFGEASRDAGAGDVAVVLGAAVAGDAPSPVFAARLDHAADLWRARRVARIVLTGGSRDSAVAAESAVGRRYLRSLGVPDSVMHAEAQSRTTRQNLACAAPLVAGETVVLVSDPLHVWRARWQARDLGLDAVASATPTTRYRSLSTRLPFLAREVWFSVVYLLAERWAPAACPR